MATDVLVVGSGSRENALAWKLAQSDMVGKVYVAPGNGGTTGFAERVDISAMALDHLADFAQEKKIGLTVAGMDDPIASGIVDVFQARGLRIFGPTKAAAQLESSKAFAKQLMRENGIPTAEFKTFTEHAEALDYVRAKGAPIVVKASGLALGKGAFVCKTLEEAEQALKEIMVDKVLKDAGNEVVIEEFLDGPEISIHVLTDGTHYKIFPPSQDHKPVGEGDTGPMTGGMGVIAPLPFVTDALMQEIEETIVRPTLEVMQARGTSFVGLLYPGLKLTPQGPKVLEFNARFGAPECEVYMRLLESDLFDLFEACIDGSLEARSLQWRSGFAVNIMLASGGYPGSYKKGLPITGIEEAEKDPDVVVFHAGTKLENGQLVTAGGRVLGVTAVGESLKSALDKAYAAADHVQFEGKYLRHDIGAKSL